jgi:hypothetical protein
VTETYAAFRFGIETIHALRYLCLHRAGVLVRPDGYPTLDVGRSPCGWTRTASAG